MTKRAYEQFCPLAKALDVVGERWTLLVVRELLLSPRRYTDLQEALPRMGTNLLAERLRHLEAAGVVRRRAAGESSGATVYELTERGEALKPALLALGRWGTGLLEEASGKEAFHPGWLALGFEATFDPEAARGVHETYEFRVGAETVNVTIEDGTMRVGAGSAEHPDLVIEAEPPEFIALALGELSPSEAIGSGRVTVEGPIEALERSLAVLGPATRDPAVESSA